MSQTLSGKTIAILATDGYEQSELESPRDHLLGEGATVHVIAPDGQDSIRGWKGKDWGQQVSVDKALSAAKADDYDALVLPGGVLNPDKLRVDAAALSLIKAFASAGKPVAAICHGPWLLAETGLASGKRVTSWPSLKTDLGNAGGRWEDSEVVVDQGLITSRNPDDLPAFNKAIVAAVSGQA